MVLIRRFDNPIRVIPSQVWNLVVAGVDKLIGGYTEPGDLLVGSAAEHEPVRLPSVDGPSLLTADTQVVAWGGYEKPIWRGRTPPENPDTGDLWLDQRSNELLMLDGSGMWEPVELLMWETDRWTPLIATVDIAASVTSGLRTGVENLNVSVATFPAADLHGRTVPAGAALGGFLYWDFTSTSAVYDFSVQLQGVSDTPDPIENLSTSNTERLTWVQTALNYRRVTLPTDWLPHVERLYHDGATGTLQVAFVNDDESERINVDNAALQLIYTTSGA